MKYICLSELPTFQLDVCIVLDNDADMVLVGSGNKYKIEAEIEREEQQDFETTK